MSRYRISIFATVVLVSTSLACSGDEAEGDASADGAHLDITEDTSDGGLADVFVPPDPTASPVAYVQQTRVADPIEYELWVTDTECEPDNCTATLVAGGDLTCAIRCELSPEMDYVLWVDPEDLGQVMIHELNDSYEIVGESRILAQNVDIFQVGPEKMVFSRATAIWSIGLDGSDETEIADVASDDGRNLPGGFHYSPQLDAIIVNIPTSLSAMDLREISLSDPGNDTLLFHFVADVEQTTGSFYQNQMEVSVSPDGQFVAIFVDALDTTETCDPGVSGACTAEYGCSDESERCIGEQWVLHVINRSAVDLLDNPAAPARCTDDSACGEYHQCDLTAPDTAGMGVCIPGKYVVGPYGRFACDTATDGGPYLDPGEYAVIVAGPLWRSDGRIVMVGGNECVDANIDATDIITINPALSNVSSIVSSTGGDHGGCYDEVEEDYDAATCNVEITSAVMSADGNTIVFSASSVSANTRQELWSIDAFGRTSKINHTDDILFDVTRVQGF